MHKAVDPRPKCGRSVTVVPTLQPLGRGRFSRAEKKPSSWAFEDASCAGLARKKQRAYLHQSATLTKNPKNAWHAVTGRAGFAQVFFFGWLARQSWAMLCCPSK